MRKISAFIFLMFSVCIYSQRIQNFTAFAAGASVGIKFTIAPGPECNGYTILHSTDSVSFNIIYNFPGVCGNTNTKQDISYTHSTPAIDQINYYKVELIPVETSNVIRVFVFGPPRAALLAYPDPIVSPYDLLNLRLANTGNTRVVGAIYDIYGKAIKNLDLITQGDLTYIHVDEFINGMYFISLNDGSHLYSTKFIIYR